MALILPNRYPGRADPASADYPQGKFKNRSAPNVEDGTYMDRDWLNDMYGFFGAVLKAAGVTPNGNVDTAVTSQVYNALSTLFPLTTSLGTAAFKNTGTGASDVALAASLFGVGTTYYNVTSSRVFDVTYTNTSVHPIMVLVSADGKQHTTLEAVVGGVTISRAVAIGTVNDHTGLNLCFVVPPGVTYQVAKSIGESYRLIWVELN